MDKNLDKRIPEPYETPRMEIVAFPTVDMITDSWSPYI